MQPLIEQQLCGEGEKQDDHGGDDQHKELITHTLVDSSATIPCATSPRTWSCSISTTARIDGPSVPL
jgi:hypothetical protein